MPFVSTSIYYIFASLKLSRGLHVMDFLFLSSFFFFFYKNKKIKINKKEYPDAVHLFLSNKKKKHVLPIGGGGPRNYLPPRFRTSHHIPIQKDQNHITSQSKTMYFYQPRPKPNTWLLWSCFCYSIFHSFQRFDSQHHAGSWPWKLREKQFGNPRCKMSVDHDLRVLFRNWRLVGQYEDILSE